MRVLGPDQTSSGDDFGWFFAAEYPQVVRLLTVVLHDRACAEDLAQESFVRLHARWDKISRFDRPEAWVRRVALNLAFSWRRRELRRRERESEIVWAVGRTAGADEGSLDRAVVLAAVARLAPRDRALVALHHLEDRPIAEVAEVLGLSPGATKVALHRARRRLADLLSEMEVRP